MNFRLTLIAVALGSASLLTLRSTAAQEFGAENPLRLYATTPLVTNPSAGTDMDRPPAVAELPVVDEERTIPDEIFAAIYPDRQQPVQQATYLEPEVREPNEAYRATPVPAAQIPVTPTLLSQLPVARKLLVPAPLVPEWTADESKPQVPAIKEPSETSSVALRPTSDRGSSKIASTQTLAAMLAESNSNFKTGNRPETLAAPAIETSESGLGQPNAELESSEDFQQMLQKIATRTCLVLFLGVGFIFVAKRWVAGIGGANRVPASKSKPTNKNNGRANQSRIQLVANLRLSGKSNLHLVEVGDQRVLIASDLNGIKSVVALNSAFSASLDTDDEEPTTELMDSNPAGTYTPATRSFSHPTSNYPAANSRQPSTVQPIEQRSTAEVEAEMKRQLAELLGGQAFKDVFYKQTRAVA